MVPLTHKHFPEFFRAVHDHEPFRWQKRLAKEVLQKGWPDVIRVPTSCGKTFVLDLAIFELAMQASLKPDQRTAARRICFVIDRRLVVDEVTETECDPLTKKPRGHAIRLRAAIQAAAAGEHDDPALKAVADRLKDLATDPADLLRVIRLRGGVYRDDIWAADPLTPTILVSTVDQIGSRLLFRGYGVGPRSRPAQAGLLAFDTRIILDEAHLSGVFAHTLDRIRCYQDAAERSPLPQTRRVSIVRMSATIKELGRAFELLDREREDIRLKPRLDASKPTEMVSVTVESTTKKMREEQPRKAREQEDQNREKLVRKLVEQAECLARHSDGSPEPRVIGVVVNRVATARNIFERLRGQKGTSPERDAILLTGRIRPYDRDCLLRQWLPRIRAGPRDGDGPDPLRSGDANS
jgi:CRISPR-associated endonuclease/helicase Cas3